MSLASEYMKRVRKLTTWQPTYPPGDRVAVGDRLQLEKDGAMINLGNMLDKPGWVDQLGVIKIEAPGRREWRAGVKRERLGSASAGSTVAAADAKASILVSFTAAGGFDLGYVSATTWRFDDVAAAKRMVVGAYREGDWESRQALVTEVVDADSATILIGSKKSTHVQIEAHATLPVNVSQINLADPQLKLQSAKWDIEGHAVICAPATPLYHCILLKEGWIDTAVKLLGDEDESELDNVFTDDPFEDEPMSNVDDDGGLDGGSNEDPSE